MSTEKIDVKEPHVLFAFQVSKSGPIVPDEYAILKIPYTEKVRVAGKDYFQGIRNGVQRRFHADATKHRYFDTWDEAWTYLCSRAKSAVDAAEAGLQHARDTLAAVTAMRCHGYTQIGAPTEPRDPTGSLPAKGKQDANTSDIPH